MIKKALVLIYFIINILLYLIQPINYIYFPFWGRMKFSIHNLVISLILVFIIIIAIIFYEKKNKNNRKYINFFVPFIFITFLQVKYLNNDYLYFKVNKHLKLYIPKTLTSNQISIDRIIKDINLEYNSLNEIFNIKEKHDLKIILFSSLHDMHEANLHFGKNYYAKYSILKSQIYICIDYWHRSLRHELVHYYQRELILNSSFSQSVKLIIFNNVLRTEALAWYLQPFTTKYFSPMDCLYSLDFTDEEIYSAIKDGKEVFEKSSGLDEVWQEYLNYSVTSLYFYSFDNKRDAVDAYMKIPFICTKNKIFKRNNDVDKRNVNYFRYLSKDLFDEKFYQYKDFKKQRKNISEKKQLEIAEWQEKIDPNLWQRVMWKVVQDTVNDSFDTLRFKYSEQLTEIVTSDIKNWDDINERYCNLLKLYNACMKKNFIYLVNYTYEKILESGYFVCEDFSEMPPDHRPEIYTKHQRAYLNYLRNKILNVL